jgi:hypothetical protein
LSTTNQVGLPTTFPFQPATQELQEMIDEADRDGDGEVNEAPNPFSDVTGSVGPFSAMEKGNESGMKPWEFLYMVF